MSTEVIIGYRSLPINGNFISLRKNAGKKGKVNRAFPSYRRFFYIKSDVTQQRSVKTERPSYCDALFTMESINESGLNGSF